MTKVTILTKYTGYSYGFSMSGETTYYKFVSQKEVIKKGQKTPQWEINIDKNHPAFANLEIKSHLDNNANEIYPYEIAFDSEKGKLPDNPEEKRFFDKGDDITVVEKTGGKSPNKGEDYIPTDEEIKGMEALLAEMRKVSNPSEEDKEEIRKLAAEITAAKKKKNRGLMKLRTRMEKEWAEAWLL